MSLNIATIRRIAKLARIRADESELERLGSELGAIIEWVEQLDEIDIEGVEALTGPTVTPLRMRDDLVTDTPNPDRILANAPDPARGYFTVPKMVE